MSTDGERPMPYSRADLKQVEEQSERFAADQVARLRDSGLSKQAQSAVAASMALTGNALFMANAQFSSLSTDELNRAVSLFYGFLKETAGSIGDKYAELMRTRQ